MESVWIILPKRKLSSLKSNEQLECQPLLNSGENKILLITVGYGFEILEKVFGR
jgi:hypothetical protein